MASTHGQGAIAGGALLHLARGLLSCGPGEALGGVLCAGGGPEVHGEGEDVEGEDEGDDPLQVGADVLLVGAGGDAKGHGQGELEEDEGELDPEGEAEDAVLAVLCLHFVSTGLISKSGKGKTD